MTHIFLLTVLLICNIIGFTPIISQQKKLPGIPIVVVVNFEYTTSIVTFSLGGVGILSVYGNIIRLSVLEH